MSVRPRRRASSSRSPTRSIHWCAFFAIGEQPTGSRDPFALRRAAQGIIRIILENGQRMPLAQVFSYCSVLASHTEPVSKGFAILTTNCSHFIADRLKVHLRDQGVRHDLIARRRLRRSARRTGRSRPPSERGSMRFAPFSIRKMGPTCSPPIAAPPTSSRSRSAATGARTTSDLDPQLLRQPEEQSLDRPRSARSAAKRETLVDARGV